jgi:hypothetical protein
MMDKVEKLARIIAGAATGLDSDTRTVSFHPALMNNISGYIMPNEQDIRPLWFRFCYAAERAIAAGFDCPDDPAPAEIAEKAPAEAHLDSGDFHEDLPAPSSAAWNERLSRMGLVHGDG